MKQHFLFYFLMLSLASARGQFDTKMQIEYPKSVADSFEIYISIPQDYNLDRTYNVVYYCDANLKSGKQLRELISTKHYDNLQNSIFVGIGHIGNYHTLRRRDFILPIISGDDTVGRGKDYGQTEKFYSYFKK